MKKSVMLLLAGFLLFTSVIFVKAKSICPDAEQASLNKIAADVKAVYEEKEIKLDPNLYPPSAESGMEATATVFRIIFTNVDEKVYVKVYNNQNDDVKVITSADLTDGTYSFDWDNMDNVTQFTYEIYSSTKTSCPGEKYLTKYLITPMYNPLSDDPICEGLEGLYACQEYVTTKMDPKDQFEKVEQYREEIAKEKKQKNKKWYTKIGDFVKNHKVAFIATGSIIVIAGVATVVVKNKRKRVI